VRDIQTECGFPGCQLVHDVWEECPREDEHEREREADEVLARNQKRFADVATDAVVPVQGWERWYQVTGDEGGTTRRVR
jgi:hypothetical protein